MVICLEAEIELNGQRFLVLYNQDRFQVRRKHKNKWVDISGDPVDHIVASVQRAIGCANGALGGALAMADSTEKK